MRMLMMLGICVGESVEGVEGVEGVEVFVLPQGEEE
jgi:hypothetical protein